MAMHLRSCHSSACTPLPPVINFILLVFFLSHYLAITSSNYLPPPISSFFLSQNTQPWHLRVERTVTTVSFTIGLLSSIPTSRNTRSKPSIKACWRRLGRWQDANFKCFERTWRSAVVNKSCQLNEPSWRLYESWWNPIIGAFLFFSSIVFYRVFFLFRRFFFFFFFFFFCVFFFFFFL
jgi:hypothetical protein